MCADLGKPGTLPTHCHLFSRRTLTRSFFGTDLVLGTQRSTGHTHGYGLQREVPPWSNILCSQEAPTWDPKGFRSLPKARAGSHTDLHCSKEHTQSCPSMRIRSTQFMHTFTGTPVCNLHLHQDRTPHSQRPPVPPADNPFCWLQVSQSFLGLAPRMISAHGSDGTQALTAWKDKLDSSGPDISPHPKPMY